MELTTSAVSEFDHKKSDRREILELKQQFLTEVKDKMASKDEVQKIFADFIGEQNKKSFNLRRELFEKISELQRDLAASVAQLVTNQDLSHRLEGKADRT